MKFNGVDVPDDELLSDYPSGSVVAIAGKSEDGRIERPRLPSEWEPPFSIEVSMHDGRFYLRDNLGRPLEYDTDHDGNTLVLCGTPEAMEAIEFALNAIYK